MKGIFNNGKMCVWFVGVLYMKYHLPFIAYHRKGLIIIFNDSNVIANVNIRTS